MKHHKHKAASTRHANSKSLQKLHGVNAAEAQMMLERAKLATAMPAPPGDPNHPMSGPPPAGGTVTNS